MTVKKTAVGLVNAQALKKMEREFDTTRITKAAQGLNEMRSRMAEIDEWQKSLHKLHNMAMHLFNDDDLRIPAGDQSIWELAYELSDEVFDWKETIDDLYDVLCELEELAAEEQEEDDSDDEDDEEDDEND